MVWNIQEDRGYPRAKRINGGVYWYLVECVYESGKRRQKYLLYLGSSRRVIERLSALLRERESYLKRAESCRAEAERWGRYGLNYKTQMDELRRNYQTDICIKEAELYERRAAEFDVFIRQLERTVEKIRQRNADEH